MQRWTVLLLTALTAAAVGLIFWQRPGPAPRPRPAASAEPSAKPAASAAPDAGAGAGPTDAGAPDAEAPAPSPEEPGVGVGEPGGSTTSDAGATLLSGEAPPPLGHDAPKSAVFGVILVQYKGAQGAPANARSREEALELAKQLAADAKKDFKAALAKGDKGSVENAGRIPRGMLEPAPEYVLFSLPKDGVSDPVDTPRGFWIVHRIE